MTPALAMALDIGATKIAGCLVAESGTITELRTRPTQPIRTPETPLPGSASGLVWNSVAAIVEDLSAAAGHPIAGLGVACAGPLDLRSGTASPVNIPQWRNFPLVEQLSALLPGVPVRLAGDGICTAAGEHWRGGGANSSDMLAIVVSTGVGGGLVQDGRLTAGRTGNAGHIGHVVVDLNGSRCGCGAQGCVETMASGPSMVRWSLANGWTPTAPAPDAIDLATDARNGHGTAIEAFVRSARALAAGIASVGALCDLTDVVIGGGVAGAADLLFPPLREGLENYKTLPFLSDLTIRPAQLGTAAGLVGAAAMVFEPDVYGSRAALADETALAGLRD